MSISKSVKSLSKNNENGAALVVALLVMAILLGVVALVFSRTLAETAISNNDENESLTFNAAEAALENTTRDFATVIENKLSPSTSDIDDIINSPVPYFQNSGYTFTKAISTMGQEQTITLTKGQFQGLISLRDQWQIDITASENRTGVETQLRRSFYNDRIPIFQFGAFYQDDLELTNPAPFLMNGRVHTNGNFFVNTLSANDIRFKSKVSIAGELVRDIRKTGATLLTAEQGSNVYAQNTLNTDTSVPVNKGSVTCTSTIGGGVLTDVTGRNFPYPNCSVNTGWASFATNFEGNLVANAKKLVLPVNKIGSDLIEMVRRGKNVGDKANIAGTTSAVAPANEDNGVLSRERFANKDGIRISLADSKDKLPQCAGVSIACGVRLDGSLGSSLGYQPLSMSDGYTATAVNGNRLAVSGREVWIKVEIVDFDYDLEKPTVKDITQDFLSLGVTEPIMEAPPAGLVIPSLSATTDTRSVIKLQRFSINGVAMSATGNYITPKVIASKNYNFVTRFNGVPTGGVTLCPTNCTADDVFANPIGSANIVSSNETVHYKLASFDNNLTRSVIVPFPIKMFDTREGNRSDNSSNLSTGMVFRNGVMSIIDIDVKNLRRFFNGEFNSKFPTTTPHAYSKGGVGLTSSDIPINRGWVVYVSDRRGDYDFDGKYKMEDVNHSSNNLLDEDIDLNGAIDTDYTNEAPNSDSTIEASFSAVTDHKYYRRAVRLINGKVLPGEFNSVNPSNTKGFTFASENGTYILGNYNVDTVTVAGGSNVTLPNAYSPLNTAEHIPAAVIADAVTFLSNSWNDSASFASPNNHSNRVASNTQVRAALIIGDSLTSSVPYTTGFNGFNGGLNNLTRFLENWSGKRMNYSGSLINLYNAYNNNGRFKCCNTVYSPPIRDWTFESSFTNPYRLPPGTPFVYFTTFTGFERVNE
jgi:Tfp pilus assembly protein PilX